MRGFRIRWNSPAVEAAARAEQLEDLLHEVWDCERWWRFQDRIDLAVQLEPVPVRARASAGRAAGPRRGSP